LFDLFAEDWNTKVFIQREEKKSVFPQHDYSLSSDETKAHPCQETCTMILHSETPNNTGLSIHSTPLSTSTEAEDSEVKTVHQEKILTSENSHASIHVVTPPFKRETFRKRYPMNSPISIENIKDSGSRTGSSNNNRSATAVNDMSVNNNCNENDYDCIDGIDMSLSVKADENEPEYSLNDSTVESSTGVDHGGCENQVAILHHPHEASKEAEMALNDLSLDNLLTSSNESSLISMDTITDSLDEKLRQ